MTFVQSTIKLSCNPVYCSRKNVVGSSQHHLIKLKATMSPLTVRPDAVCGERELCLLPAKPSCRQRKILEGHVKQQNLTDPMEG